MRCSALVLILLAPAIAPAASGLGTLPQGRQDGELTLAQLIERMDAAVAPARDLTFISEGASSGSFSMYMSMSYRHEFASASDGTIRVRGGMRTVSGRLAMARGLKAPETETVLTADGLCLRRQTEGRPVADKFPLRAAAVRLPTGSTRIDPLLFETMGGPPDQNLLMLYHLSPKRALALDPEWRLLGRRTVDGQDVYVLISRRQLGEPSSEARNAAMNTPYASVKKLHVGVKDLLVKRVDVRLIASNAYSSANLTWAIRETADVGGVAFPIKVELRWGMPSYGGTALHVTHTASAIKRGDPGQLLPDDLYASSPHLSVDEISRALIEKPGDADLLASRAIARSGMYAGRGNPLMGMPQGKQPDSAALAADLEKAVDARWALSPVRALMGLYVETKEVEKLTTLIDRIEKDERRPCWLALDAAEHLNGLGEYDRALTILDGITGAPAWRVAEERMVSLLAKGDVPAAVEAFRVGLAGHPSPVEWIERLVSLVSLLPASAPKLEKLKVVDAVDELLKAAPQDPALNLARLRLVPEAQTARVVLERATDDRVLDAALAVVKEKLDGAKADELAPLLAALEPAEANAALSSKALALRGAALIKAERREEAKAAFEKALQPGLAIAPDLVTQIENLGDDGLTARACRGFLDGLRKNGPGDHLMALYQEKGPLQALARIYSRDKEHAKLYHDIKGIDLGTWYGMSLFFMVRTDQQEFVKAAAVEATKDKSELAGLKWLAASLGGPYAEYYRSAANADPVALYEKAREWAPADAEVLQELAALYAQRGDTKKAIAAATDLIAMYDAGTVPTATRRWSRERAQLAVADAHRQAGDLDASRAGLDKLDLAKSDLQPHELWLASTVLEQCEQFESAAAALARCEDEGYRPYLRLARLYEKLKNWAEAMRCYNRAIKSGYDSDIPAPDAAVRQLIRSSDRGEQPAAPDKLRTELYKRIGDDYFIDKLLAGPLPALSAGDDTRARRLFDDLCGEELVARDTAEEELRKMGSRVSMVLRPGLTSTDDEVKARVRAMLNEWAEPR